MATHQVQLRTKEREYFEGPVAEWKFSHTLLVVVGVNGDLLQTLAVPFSAGAQYSAMLLQERNSNTTENTNNLTSPILS
jgi:hypothetical protein